MNYSSHTIPSHKLEGWRARVMLILLILGFVLLGARALYLQGVNNDFYQQKGEARYSRVIEMPATRGMITDRNGEPLAISTPVESICASPDDVELSPEQSRRLAKLLGMDKSEIQKRLAGKERNFVYLKRQLPPELAAKVMALDIPGIFSQREYRRYYPAGQVAAHLVGFTGLDESGQEGMELAYQSQLAGKPGSRRVIRDRLGRIVEDVESIRAPQQGKDLVLSIDHKIQYLAYRELKAAVEANKARGGALVVLDAASGEVLALVNQPDYNPNNRSKLTGQQTRNRTLTDAFEPGSTMKPFTVAAALEAGLVEPDSVIDTAPGWLQVGRATIHDSHPEGLLTVGQVIQKSSNVGSAKMALQLPPEKMWNLFHQAGFGAAPKAGFPGEVGGKLRPYKTWKPIEQATMSYGHGITASLLQLARAYTLFASAGELKDITLLKAQASAPSKAVLQPQTAAAVRAMLELAVQPGGTAPKAQVPGYRVAGKTGTAHKQEGQGYAAKRYVSSFIGMAPASNPRLIVAVMLDEPSAGQYYGGVVAAPVFSSVMGSALRALSIPMDAPLQEAALPADEFPEVREEG